MTQSNEPENAPRAAKAIEGANSQSVTTKATSATGDKSTTDRKAPTKHRQAKRKKDSGSGRRVMIAIAVLLGFSGIVRLAQGAERIFMPHVTNQVAAVPDETCAPIVDESKFLIDLRERAAVLAEKERDIEARAQTITIAEAAITAKLDELALAEAELAKTMALADRAADDDVARLVTLYENMKPKQAAPLFEEMAPEFAAGFLSRMRPDAGAAILAGLDPKIAYSISVLMAGRNANAPKN
ncbi:MotE family protein [Albirhodobacter sp. R86504]|uniref:MotE family protein n=1 Tax=Albirhodobacter sp. R86504 TaxID=3093848 RepID=UPI0036722AB3